MDKDLALNRFDSMQIFSLSMYKEVERSFRFDLFSQGFPPPHPRMTIHKDPDNMTYIAFF